MGSVTLTLQLLILGHVITAYHKIGGACVVPTNTLPVTAFTYRPSTLQIFTGLNLSCSGFVTGWRVIFNPPATTSSNKSSSQARINGVYLGVFRQITASKFQLMGLTEVNSQQHHAKNSKNEKTRVWHVIPARPQFPVQRGDFIGMFYKRWFISEREVSIPVAGEEQVPADTPPAYVAMKDWYDVSDTLETGGILSLSDAARVRRLPAVQALVNVGICGNAKMEDAEECDDANTADGDGCSSICRKENRNDSENAIISICGNGQVETPPEECDDGNKENGDGCSSKCRLEDPDGPLCGNGKLEPGEQCDDGNNVDKDGCSAICRVELRAACGNGLLETGEQCDDGNAKDGDGCNARCLLEGLGACGDSVLDVGEECDDGNRLGGDGCSPNCTLEMCGNGRVDVGEECDDGQLNGEHFAASCSVKCKSKRCGNGILEPMFEEQCDDANARPGDGCSANCTLEICGNGKVDANEECDDGNFISGDGCTASCTKEAVAVVEKKLAKNAVKRTKYKPAKAHETDEIYSLMLASMSSSKKPTTTTIPGTTSTTTTTTTTASPSTSFTTTPTTTSTTKFDDAYVMDFSNYAEGETFSLGGAAAALDKFEPFFATTPFYQRSVPVYQSFRRRSAAAKSNFPAFSAAAFHEQRPAFIIQDEITHPVMTTTSSTSTSSTTKTSKKVSPNCYEAPRLGGICREKPTVAWFYNSLTKHCDWFYDKSCYTGKNYFISQHDCRDACGALLVNDY